MTEQKTSPADRSSIKEGVKCDPSNYRPVSLTCIVYKLIEHVICCHILHHVDDNAVLSPFQDRGRKIRSCETQLLLTTNDITNLHDANLQVDIAILDRILMLYRIRDL